MKAWCFSIFMRAAPPQSLHLCVQNELTLKFEKFCYDKFLFVVPRVLFDGWKGNDFHILFSSEEEQQECIRTLLDVVEVSISISKGPFRRLMCIFYDFCRSV